MSKTKSAKDNWKRFATKRRWSEAEARAVVDAWRASGQRVQKFAREQGVGAWRLRYWVPRLDPRVTARTTSRQSSTTAEVRFVPAVLSGTASGNRPAVVIRLPDGIAVELHDAEHAGALEVGQLVAQLRGVAS
jgi:hypothetical protein